MTGFAPERSDVALQAFAATLGDRHLVDVLREDATAYACLLGDADGTPTHLVAWRPVAGDDGATVLPVNAVPAAARALAGLDAAGEPAPLPTAVGTARTLPLGAAPLVVSFDSTAGGPGAAGPRGPVRLPDAPYPNPATDAVTIRFTAGEAAPLRIGVMDAPARRVRTLYDATPRAGEPVTLRCDTAGLAIGLYAVRAAASFSARFTVLR